MNLKRKKNIPYLLFKYLTLKELVPGYCLQQENPRPGVMAYTFNPSRGRRISWVQDQPGLHRETLSWKQKEKKNLTYVDENSLFRTGCSHVSNKNTYISDFLKCRKLEYFTFLAVCYKEGLKYKRKPEQYQIKTDKKEDCKAPRLH